MTVYTCFTPGYDAPRPDILNIPPLDIFKSDRLNAKMPKILPHVFIDDDVTVWCDANIFLSSENLAEIEQKLKTADVVVLTHPERNCVYEEARVCIEAGLDDPERINGMMYFLRAAEWPENAGLYGCGVVAMNHQYDIKRALAAWWIYVTRWSSRDQLSFPIIAWAYRLRVATIPFESVEIKPHLI